MSMRPPKLPNLRYLTGTAFVAAGLAMILCLGLATALGFAKNMGIGMLAFFYLCGLVGASFAEYRYQKRGKK